mmetsp:Transcript_27292/g.78416  ORF Transcript_27292/g.78416 Transcript_27292/m.78416 type:complete len:508 (+) Transcript_27292:38-1561(+)
MPKKRRRVGAAAEAEAAAEAPAAGAGEEEEDDDPPAEQLEEALRDVLRRSREPAARQRLGRDVVAAAAGSAEARARLAPLALELQAPALERLGLPAGEEGAERLRHAVHRRIAEGHQLLEPLALEARALIDVAEWPDQEMEAEEFMAMKVEETDSRCEGGELSRRCSSLLARELDRGSLPEATVDYLRQLLDAGEVPAPAVMSLLVMAKIGLPLSAMKASPALEWKEVPVLQAPSPAALFREHVLPSRPAVLRGCFNDQNFSPLDNFPNFAWLREKCGRRRVPAKSYVHDDQAGRPVFLGDPCLRLPLAAYLGMVEAHEREGARVPFYLGKLPLRAELPELADAIEQAPCCPQRLYGSCFGELKPEGVHTYLGCGRNTTPVHFDAHENLLLCLCGRKRLLLYPPSDARCLYPANDFTRSAVVPFVQPQDLPEDLQEMFALAAGAAPMEVELTAGDMLYLPVCWWHCVEGSQDRNMILNWWFALHPEKLALAQSGSDGTQVREELNPG